LADIIGIPYDKLFLRRCLYRAIEGGVTCEIGTGHTINAKNILKHIKPSILYLIDPIRPNEVDGLNGNVKFVKGLSQDTVDKIPDNLDNLYIDGDHTYQGCKKDLENYVPKVKADGFVGGHDWHHPQIAKAVIEYCEQHDYILNTSDVLLIPNWFFIKRRR